MSRAFISLIIADHIATVTLDRPPVNAFNLALREELAEVFSEIEIRPEVRVAILIGSTRAFSAGVDIHELAAAPPSDAIPRNRRFQEILGQIARCRAPVIAAINGYALGGGLELALACDLRVAAEDARLGQPEIVLGGIPGGGGPQRLARLVGVARAKKLILTGDPISASEGYRIGLIDELAPAGRAIEPARELAQRIAIRPPRAVSAAKQAIDLGAQLPLDAGLALDLRFVGEVAGTEDRQEGLRAFLEKRPPRVVGR